MIWRFTVRDDGMDWSLSDVAKPDFSEAGLIMTSRCEEISRGGEKIE